LLSKSATQNFQLEILIGRSAHAYFRNNFLFYNYYKFYLDRVSGLRLRSAM